MDTEIDPIALILAGVANFGIIFAAGYLSNHAWTAVRDGLAFKINGVPVFIGLGWVSVLLVAGVLINLFRDVRLWRSVAVVQIAIAVLVGL